MDWFLGAAEQVSDFRRELTRHLTRHGAAGSGGAIADARLVASEAVGNAFRHTGGPVWVSLSWTSEFPVLQVLDIGPGFDTGSLTAADADPARDGPDGRRAAAARSLGSVGLDVESGRGLLIIQAAAPEVELSLRKHSGVMVTIRLPVPRRRAASMDPPRHHSGVLPAMQEARPRGGFGKESFLRASGRAAVAVRRGAARSRRCRGGGRPGRHRRGRTDGGGVPAR